MNGINVIGHVMDSSGLGNTARLFMRAIQQRGVPVAALDIDGKTGSPDRLLPGVQYCGSVDELPHSINFVIVSIVMLPSMWRRRLAALSQGRFVNVGLVFWELQSLPKAWIPSLRMFDAIAVSSQFVRSAVELVVPDVPTIFAEHPLDPSNTSDAGGEALTAQRRELGIQPDEVVFAASFDLRSDFARKNPLAVLAAFKLAFPTEPKARLLLKASGASKTGVASERAARILAEIQQDPRIVFVDQTLEYSAVMRLYAACDAFVSLHRAEGLGLGPMEAMLLGKPVIATGYSGNMSYMSEQNSIPVRYRLVRPEGAAWQFSARFSGASAYWAEPDVDAAAAAMRKLFASAELRAKLGQLGREDVRRRQETAWSAPFLDQIDALRLTPRPAAHHAAQLKRIAAQELLDPVLRGKNLEAMLKRT